MIHYHGTPITPRAALYQLAGRSFCVSFAKPQDVAIAHQIGEGVMLDNGAFSAWRRGYAPDWDAYYAWCDPWLDYQTTWAVIPDVIDGDERANDKLLRLWPFGERGTPVWHLDESLERLLRLCDGWPRVCLGSSGEFAIVGSDVWHRRMHDAMNFICRTGRAPCWLHMLRGMSLAGSHYPFASVDSTDIGRNHNRPQNSPRDMAERWDALQCPARWEQHPEQIDLCG